MHLTITAKGQVTLKKEVLQHLGVKAGGQVEVKLCANRRIELRPVLPTRSIDELAGLLKGKGNGRRATIHQMNEAIAAGGQGGMKRGI